MRYKALDIARYIINYSNENNMGITNLKLQKILYYIQASFLVNKEKDICFEEDIVNWEYGPVVAEVYSEFRSYGRDELPNQKTYTKIEFDETTHNIRLYEKTFDENIILSSDKEIIEKIVNKYKNNTAFELVRKTHEENPWKESKRNGIIQNEKIKEYFVENKEKIS